MCSLSHGASHALIGKKCVFVSLADLLKQKRQESAKAARMAKKEVRNTHDGCVLPRFYYQAEEDKEIKSSSMNCIQYVFLYSRTFIFQTYFCIELHKLVCLHLESLYVFIVTLQTKIVFFMKCCSSSEVLEISETIFV